MKTEIRGTRKDTVEREGKSPRFNYEPQNRSIGDMPVCSHRNNAEWCKIKRQRRVEARKHAPPSARFLGATRKPPRPKPASPGAVKLPIENVVICFLHSALSFGYLAITLVQVQGAGSEVEQGGKREEPEEKKFHTRARNEQIKMQFSDISLESTPLI